MVLRVPMNPVVVENARVQRRFRIPRDRPRCGCTCGGVGVPERLKTDGQDASVA
jgi:hypothetical protein